MADLARLLNPKSVCFVGGGQMEGPILASRRAGYEGQIYVVNPKRSEIAGIACFQSIADLPEAPDAAMVGLSPARSVEAVAALSKCGAGGAVVIVSGFAETGEAGHDLQKRLIDGAGEMPLLGPNCMGFINQFSGAAIWADDTPIARQDGPAAALISQSGALMIGMLGVEQAFPVGYAASIGNQAKTTIGDLIHGVIMDERIRVIGLYLEGINDGAVLGEACQAALSKGVPVIALKGGDGEAAEKVALSHTASMVVERDLWTAFKRRFGVVEVSSPKALVETLKLLTVGEAAKGNRLSLASYSGGFNGLAANRAASLGLALPAPSTDCHNRMEAVLPADVAIGNPFDLNIPFSAREGLSLERTEPVADLLCDFANDTGDQFVFFIDIPRGEGTEVDQVWAPSMDALIPLKEKYGKPVTVAGILPDGLPIELRERMQAHGIPALSGYSETMEAFSLSVEVGRILDTDREAPRTPSLLLGSSLDGVPSMLDEAQSKSLLSRYGLVMPERAVTARANLGDAGDRVGYPVALKVVSDEIAHKAKAGGVRLNIASRQELETAADDMARIVKDRSGVSVESFLVEAMVEYPASEMIIGIKRHPALGLALVVGRGGVSVEEEARFQTILLPLMNGDLEKVFDGLGLQGERARAAMAIACGSVARFAEDNQQSLHSLDVNPVIVTEEGEAIAADALIVMADPQNVPREESQENKEWSYG